MKITKITPKPEPPSIQLNLELTTADLEKLEADRWLVSSKFNGDACVAVPFLWDFIQTLLNKAYC
jgi:hypothetical protein